MSTLPDLLPRALDARRALFESLHAEATDCYRLFHGATEGRPGLSVDRYGPILLVQSWGEPLEEGALELIEEIVEGALGLGLKGIWNHRGKRDGVDERSAIGPEAPVGLELGVRYDVRPRHRGNDPLLFLDLRAGRRWVKKRAAGKSLLNLFAYTSGVGVAAGAAGAREVWNVDFAASALEVGRTNARLNELDEASIRFLHEDFFPAARQLAGLPIRGRGARRRFTRLEPRRFDVVVLDPPRWSKGPFGAVDVVRDYPSLLKPCLLATEPGGRILFTNHVPSVALEDFIAMARRCGEKAGRPLAALEVIEPETDFPSPDGKHPLKILAAVVEDGA